MNSIIGRMKGEVIITVLTIVSLFFSHHAGLGNATHLVTFNAFYHCVSDCGIARKVGAISLFSWPYISKLKKIRDFFFKRVSRNLILIAGGPSAWAYVVQ